MLKKLHCKIWRLDMLFYTMDIQNILDEMYSFKSECYFGEWCMCFLEDSYVPDYFFTVMLCQEEGGMSSIEHMCSIPNNKQE